MDIPEFHEALRSHLHPVVVDFWAPWCMPCRLMEPALKKTAAEYAGRVDLWQVNADEHPDLLRSLGIMGIPTMMAYRGEQQVARQVGAQSPSALAKLFEAALTGEAPVRRGLSGLDRLLRLSAAAVIAWLGLASGPSYLLLLIAGIVAFSGVYDRCPIWQALAPRIKALLHL
jgi:thioredoxin